MSSRPPRHRILERRVIDIADTVHAELVVCPHVVSVLKSIHAKYQRFASVTSSPPCIWSSSLPASREATDESPAAPPVRAPAQEANQDQGRRLLVMRRRIPTQPPHLLRLRPERQYCARRRVLR